MTWLLTGAIMLVSALAVAQERGSGPPPKTRAFSAASPTGFDSTFKNAGKGVANFGHEAGVAAKSTVDATKDAAGAVARIPGTRVVTGHAKCKNAPNARRDCLAAAMEVCKAKGFEGGKSLDMTTAEVCPAKALLSGRGECHDETFVSRALCQ
ncbi:MAG: hypothetical protein WDN48_02995 [Pseudolabrys sp.]